jgi:hypothetical protein
MSSFAFSVFFSANSTRVLLIRSLFNYEFFTVVLASAKLLFPFPVSETDKKSLTLMA